MSRTPLGIDLGTTFSEIAKWENTPNHIGPKMYNFPLENSDTLQSKVYVTDPKDKDGNHIVGTASIAPGRLHPDRFYSAFKRGMDNNLPMPCGEGQITPVELSSYVVHEALKVAGNVENPMAFVPGGLVVSVPYYFKEPQNLHTVEAVKKAMDKIFAGRKGYSPDLFLRLVPEPIAAGLSYIMEHPNDIHDDNIFVFDLGGGTFDVTIFKVHNDLKGKSIKFTVLSTAGDSRLGGEDFDKSLMRYILESEGIDPNRKFESQLDKQTLLKLQMECTDCKCTLSSSDTYNMVLQFFDGQDLDRVIQRDEFDKCFCGEEGSRIDYKSKISDIIDEALQLAHLSPNAIDRVVLVGGSSNIPIVRRMLGRKFGDDKIYYGDTRGAVAQGAALIAAMEMDKKNVSQGKEPEFMTLWEDFEIVEPTAHALGIMLANGHVDEVVHRNTMTPAHAVRFYHPTTLTADGEKSKEMSIDIKQGNTQIGKVDFPEIYAHGRKAEDIKIKLEFVVQSTEIKTIATVPQGNKDGSDLVVESTLNINR